MYRALYRKWRPLRFQDVVGQTAIVTALRNQIATQHIGHAYLFTGVRGTGKTSCAKIFAKAINCTNPNHGDPCCECAACRGIDDGSILDVVEMDAASNNGVDNIRDLRDETAYTPSICNYKVYIIDEVHMLSTAAFNALLKTLEEPPPHIVFILATTEIQKVPATILSRCQRYDFTRIQPADLAARAKYVASQEGFSLTDGAADLIARLADGAARDTLSILDTCAGVTTEIDEEIVRRMAGVTDRSYLFEVSDAIAKGNAVAALACLATLRQKSVDLKRLTEELIQHYRNIMLSALPNGTSLLSGVSPEEEAQYATTSQQISQSESVRAIRALGGALERMSRGNDQRIELELAIFSLSAPAPTRQAAPTIRSAATGTPMTANTVPFASTPRTAPAPFSAAPAQATTVAPTTPAPVQNIAQQPAQSPAAQPTIATATPDTGLSHLSERDAPPPPEHEMQYFAPEPEVPAPTTTNPPPAGEITQHISDAHSAQLPWANEPETPVGAIPEPAPTPQAPVAPTSDKPAQKVAPSDSLKAAIAKQPMRSAMQKASTANAEAADGALQPFAPWPQVIQILAQKDPMLYNYLKRSRAYRQNKRVLIEGGKVFRDFIRVNKDSQALIKQVILEVTDEKMSIGPYDPQTAARPVASAEDALKALSTSGLPITINDK